MRENSFAPGFRFSSLDAAILIAGVTGSAWAGATLGWPGFAIAFVVGHFFLFCNVFRISRLLELAWAAVFTGLAMSTIVWKFPGWTITAAVSLLVTVAAVAVEMRKPSYHGVAWQRINPGVRQWWEAQHGEEVASNVSKSVK